MDRDIRLKTLIYGLILGFFLISVLFELLKL